MEESLSFRFLNPEPEKVDTTSAGIAKGLLAQTARNVTNVAHAQQRAAATQAHYGLRRAKLGADSLRSTRAPGLPDSRE